MPALINGGGSVCMLLTVALITFSLEAKPPRLLAESDIDAVLKSRTAKGLKVPNILLLC